MNEPQSHRGHRAKKYREQTKCVSLPFSVFSVTLWLVLRADAIQMRLRAQEELAVRDGGRRREFSAVADQVLADDVELRPGIDNVGAAVVPQAQHFAIE